MPVQGFGSVDVTVSYTGQFVYSDGIPLPTGRAMANGSQACLITALYGYVAGRGGSRTVYMALGSAGTQGFGVGAGGSATDTGWIGTNAWLVQGGTARFSYNFNGLTYFARQNGGGGAAYDSAGQNFGGYLAGNYSWAQAPAAPPLYGASPTGTSGAIQVNFAGSPDDGGAGVSGYLLQWSQNPGFPNDANTGQMITGNGQQVVGGLDVGKTHYFRVSARNAVSDAAGTTGAWSGTVSAFSPGVPSVPQNLTSSTSVTQVGAINLSWSAPSNTGGGITGYNIYKDSVLFARVGNITAYTATGLTPHTSSKWDLRARNSYADQNNTFGPNTPPTTVTASGLPTAPLSVQATASISTAGQVTVTWSPPTTAGVGGITKYSLYFSTNELISSTIPAGTTTYTVNGLIPGTVYGFYVRAWNALATTVGTPGANSAISNTTAMGQPDAPSNLLLTPSATVSGRLTLTWTQTGVYSGFNIYETTTGPEVFVGYTRGLSYTLDNLSPVAHKYVIHARNAVTDATTPVSQGPVSATATGTPGSTTTQSTPATGVTNSTTAVFNGTYAIVGTTATTMTYARTNANIPATAVVGSNVTNNTNTTLNGTYTITSIPTLASFTYARTTPSIAANTSVLQGSATDTTNVLLNGTYAVTAVDNANKTVSYARVGSNISTRSTFGTITNQTNTIYNGTNLTITGVTDNTIQYSKTSANIAETNASGVITDVTNDTVYNGTYVVTSTPTYDTFTYGKVNADLAPGTVAWLGTYTADGLPGTGVSYRAISPSRLQVKYRSGWIG